MQEALRSSDPAVVLRGLDHFLGCASARATAGQQQDLQGLLTPEQLPALAALLEGRLGGEAADGDSSQVLAVQVCESVCGECASARVCSSGQARPSMCMCEGAGAVHPLTPLPFFPSSVAFVHAILIHSSQK